MLCGLDQLSGNQANAVRRRLREARVGVLTHAAACNRRGRQTVDALDELGAAPSIVFTPEHGYYGVAQAEEPVDAPAVIDERGPRLVSLYGAKREQLAPRDDDLEQLDLLVIDLVDIGSRYYTYVWAALLAARAAAKRGLHTLVLDRPNPIGADPRSVEGAPQADGFLSYVGLEPVPVRHCLTLGELLCLFFERDGNPLGADGSLSVVPTQGWERQRTAQAWGQPFIAPSPNMPTLETALVYPGGCLLEGTNLSEGRGTTLPFQLLGAPFLDGKQLAKDLGDSGGALGALIRPTEFRPSFDKHAGQICRGVAVHVTHPSMFHPVATYLRLISLARRQAPDAFGFRSTPYEFEHERPAFDLLTGSATARELISEGATPEDVVHAICPVDPSYREVLAQAEQRLAKARA